MAWQTENGWYQIPASECDRSVVPGTNVWVPLQRGLVNTIMKAFAADYHHYVEPLYQTDIGGWTPTNVVPTSNHLSATAMDLRWNSHPFRVKGTFSADQMVAIRELLDFYENLIWWGGDWKNPIDEMHWQMNDGTYNSPKLQDFVNRKIMANGFSTFKRKLVPVVPTKPVVPGDGGTYWADVSQYQKTPIDTTYPHKIFCYRTNTGSTVDTLCAENTKRALIGLNDKRLKLVIAYYFFRPGQENCDLHRKLLEDNGLWGHPRLLTMVDVESDGGKITGDQSWEVNDEIQRLRGWYGDMNRVIGYWNPNADSGLWLSRPYGLSLVIPQYSNPRSARTPGDLSTVKDRQAYKEAFAHQFTDQAMNCPPWEGQGIDMNWTPHTVEELLAVFGIVTDTRPTTPPGVDVIVPDDVDVKALCAAIGGQFLA